MRTVILAGGLGSRLSEETAVRPRENRAGDGGQINGFFVAQPSVVDLIEGPDTVRECGQLEQLAAHREPRGYRHEGFWHPMDRLRDKVHLETLWQNGDAPWKRW